MEKAVTGLGLSYSEHILEGLKKISVTSTLGKGSIFSFSAAPWWKKELSGTKGQILTRQLKKTADCALINNGLALF